MLWHALLVVSMLYLVVGSFWFQPWYVLWVIAPAALLPGSRFTRYTSLVGFRLFMFQSCCGFPIRHAAENNHDDIWIYLGGGDHMESGSDCGGISILAKA